MRRLGGRQLQTFMFIAQNQPVSRSLVLAEIDKRSAHDLKGLCDIGFTKLLDKTKSKPSYMMYILTKKGENYLAQCESSS